MSDRDVLEVLRECADETDLYRRAGDEIESLREENSELHRRICGLVADPQSVQTFWDRDSQSTLAVVKHWGVKALAMSLAETLAGAPNCVTMEVGPFENAPPLVVTIQRKSGKSPSQVIGELKTLLAEIPKARDGIRYDEQFYQNLPDDFFDRVREALIDYSPGAPAHSHVKSPPS